MFRRIFEFREGSSGLDPAQEAATRLVDFDGSIQAAREILVCGSVHIYFVTSFLCCAPLCVPFLLDNFEYARASDDAVTET